MAQARGQGLGVTGGVAGFRTGRKGKRRDAARQSRNQKGSHEHAKRQGRESDPRITRMTRMICPHSCFLRDSRAKNSTRRADIFMVSTAETQRAQRFGRALSRGILSEVEGSGRFTGDARWLFDRILRLRVPPPSRRDAPLRMTRAERGASSSIRNSAAKTLSRRSSRTDVLGISLRPLRPLRLCVSAFQNRKLSARSARGTSRRRARRRSPGRRR
ncbi:hypothetical protein EV701_11181 [Chthoniobacter flavus]|nr:hypothetical protein EV701_11181 [Chthoniobacter flavus]